MTTNRRDPLLFKPRQLHSGGVYLGACHRASHLSVILIEVLVVDSLQFASGQDGKQLPTELQRVFNVAVRVVALRNILVFKGVRKFRVQLIDLRQRGFAEDCLLYTSDAADD